MASRQRPARVIRPSGQSTPDIASSGHRLDRSWPRRRRLSPAPGHPGSRRTPPELDRDPFGMVFVRDRFNRKEFKMQTQASQQHKQRGQVPGIAMVISCAAVTTAFLTWDPSSIGSANDNLAPARLSAVPAQAAGAKEAPADAGRGSSDRPTRPMCAKLSEIASTQETKRSAGPVGCGLGSNLAGGTPASNQS
jgi:hypothetical protein